MKTLSTLVCKRDLGLALVTLPRMIAAWGGSWRLEVFDDGTLEEGDWAKLRAVFPDGIMHPREVIRERVEGRLARYPSTLQRFRQSPLAIKLTAVPLQHARETFYYADPDVVLRRPVNGWWPEHALPVVQDERRVGLANELCKWWERLRLPLARRVNTGLMRMPPGVWDLDKIEWFVSHAQPFRNEQVWEQTCWAFLLAGREHVRFHPRTVWCDYYRDPLAATAPAVHLIGHHKRLAERLLGERWETRPETARFLRGADGGLGYQVVREADRVKYELQRRWLGEARSS